MTQTTAPPAVTNSLAIAVFATDRCRRLAQRLAGHGYEIVLIDDAGELVARAGAGNLAVAIVHVASNRPHHRALVAQLAPACSVLALTGDSGPDGETARIRALMAGAEAALPVDVDYVELLWNVQALLRRSAARTPRLRVGPLAIDSQRRDVRLRGEPLALTPIELQLLVALARSPDVAQRREELLATVWDWPDADRAGSRTLDNHASRLRRKLARDGDDFVVAVRGVGYRLR
ncbi:response regulator transcription factor [Conexibacter stalactiti]|uniref:Response regulator transcription factor n=1 Tax=Conexibacter stalactiti TaxID=1940611 RepID=A0ABU4HI56_9ACTN|nr:response regulator transcription factor [Conexibacter stalactiti]MDW5592997.1 response regulator transcription factor [Conexibacter stalactiti]MEC5033638.1 response regulator transcription factor [Conexibacter stalactiti]